MANFFPARRSARRPPVARRPALARRSYWVDLLKTLFDAGLVFLLLALPLLLGGRHPVGRLAYETTVVLMAVCWLTRNCLRREARWRVSGAEWLWIGALVLLILQLVPLPASLLSRLSPYQLELLPTWFSQPASNTLMGVWNTLSLTPLATRDGLAMLAAHGTLFTLLVQRLDRLEDVERTLQWVAVAAVSMATVGLLQYFSRTDYFVWVFEHPTRVASRTVTGPFINANHFAHFLALGLGALIIWLHRLIPVMESGFSRRSVRHSDVTKAHEWQLIGVALACGVVVLAVILTQSRGGILVAAFASVCCVGLLVRARRMTMRSLAVYGALLLIALVAVYLHGHERVQRELETLVDGSWEQLDRGAARQRVWQANLQIARRFPVLGAGVGCHAELYPVFFPYEYDVEFTHAESGYLQVLSETGLPGAGLLLIAIVALVHQTWRAWSSRPTPRHAACLAAIVGGLVASLVHSVFDFPWYIPSCMALTVVLLAGLNRLARMPRELEEPWFAQHELPRFARAQLAVVWLVALCVLTITQIPAARAASAWNNYLMVSLAQQPLSVAEFGQTADAQFMAEQREKQADRTRLMARYLQQIIARNPRDARAHARLAFQCVRIFEDAQMRSDNAMDLVSLRDAALASRFPDRASQDRWLTAAIGENRRWLDLAQYHLREALNISPLDGKAYLHLSQLVFLDGIGLEGTATLMDQARRVRPYDPSVLFGLGRDAALRGDFETAMTYWKDAFHRSPEYRQQIIVQLAGAMSADQFLNLFEPDEDGIRLLFVFYRGAGMEGQAATIAPLLASRQVASAEAKQGRDASLMWEKAHATYRYLGNSEQSLACARRAVEASPLRYQSRFILAQELVRGKQWREAIDAVEWCLLRRPHDATLRRMHQLAGRGLAEGEVAQQSDEMSSTSRLQ